MPLRNTRRRSQQTIYRQSLQERLKLKAARKKEKEKEKSKATRQIPSRTVQSHQPRKKPFSNKKGFHWLIASDTKRRQHFQRSKHPDVKEKQTDNTQQKNPPPQKKRETEKKNPSSKIVLKNYRVLQAWKLADKHRRLRPQFSVCKSRAARIREREKHAHWLLCLSSSAPEQRRWSPFLSSVT